MPHVSVREVIPELPLPPYFVSSSDVGSLRARLRDAGFQVFEANVGDCIDERCVLDRLGDALPFPDFFGQNWDAFDDCVGDLQREGAGQIALVLNQSHELLGSSPHVFARSVHLLQDVVQAVVEDRDEGLQLEVFFAGEFDRHG